MSKTTDQRRCWALSMLACGDCCGLCESWSFTVQGAKGAPAVGDCTEKWVETMRTATAKPCEHFKRDTEVVKAARGVKA